MGPVPALFPHDFPDVRSAAELAREVARVEAQFPTFDPYYVTAGCIPERRERLDTLWARYYPRADRHFNEAIRQGFPGRDFHARTWEMYLGVVLEDHGFLFAPTKDEGPDIHATAPFPMWIEAVAPDRGTVLGDAVLEVKHDGVGNVPERQLLLRLAQAVRDKQKKREKYVKRDIVASTDAFVVAVNAGRLEYPEDTLPRMAKLLLGAGNLAVDLGRREVFREPLEPIAKQSGSRVPGNLFDDYRYAGISGVIYSSRRVMDHPADLGADCVYIANHRAKQPIDLQTFAFLDRYEKQGDTIQRFPGK